MVFWINILLINFKLCSEQWEFLCEADFSIENKNGRIFSAVFNFYWMDLSWFDRVRLFSTQRSKIYIMEMVFSAESFKSAQPTTQTTKLDARWEIKTEKNKKKKQHSLVNTQNMERFEMADKRAVLKARLNKHSRIYIHLYIVCGFALCRQYL